jgi:VWFA-related protein
MVMIKGYFSWLLIIVLDSLMATIGQGQQSNSAPTIEVDSNLVIVDVVVTDARQIPVHNLNVEDFAVREDGHSQVIKNFEEHRMGELSLGHSRPTGSKLDAGVFTNDSPVPATGSLNIVLLDKLNTPAADQTYAMDQLSQYLRGAPTGTRIAVVSLTSRSLFLVQGFTSDPELLRAALNGRSAGIHTSLFLDNSVSGREEGSSTTAIKAKFRRQLTLNALNQLGRYLHAFPGRKNLVWLSASFPFAIQPEDWERLSPSAALDREFSETVNLLAFNQVAVYPVDARGLVGESWFDASNAGTGNPVADVKGLSNSVQSTISSTTAQQFAMKDVAEPTGGRAFMNSNDLQGATAKAVEAGSNYYTLTYSSTNHKQDGRYRNIQVKLDRQEVNLAYRRGYFASRPDSRIHQNDTRIGRAESASYSAIRGAMSYGAPEPTEIRFEAHIQPVLGDEEPSVAPGNQDLKTKGPYRRYRIHYVAHQQDIQCVASNGTENVCNLEFAAYVYDENGAVTNTQNNEIKVVRNSTNLEALNRPSPDLGFQYQQDISVPVKGEYHLRIGIHDLTSGRVGAVEVPISAVSNLPPVPIANRER